VSTKTTRLSLKVQPNTGRNQVVGFINDVWKVKIAAPPDKGKANKELIEFLSDILGLRKDNITILKGETSHNKIIAITGFNLEEVTKTLAAICQKSQ
jgi:uncharacterized protein (TIGR00251 family)